MHQSSSSSQTINTIIFLSFKFKKMKLTHLFVIMGVMSETVWGQIVDGGIVEGAIDWVMGTHFTFHGSKSHSQSRTVICIRCLQN